MDAKAFEEENKDLHTKRKKVSQYDATTDMETHGEVS